MDSDGDSLSDADELARGSDPLASDSDRDGVADADELNGWPFTYNTGKTTRIVTATRPTPTATATDSAMRPSEA